MLDNRDKSLDAEEQEGTLDQAGSSRRTLLKKGAGAMPAVLTLQSGASLAATSAYIGSVSRAGSNIAGHVHVLDVRKAEPLPNGTTFRFVDTNYADVYIIPDGDYYPSKGKSGTPVKADEFGRTGGIKYLDAPGNPEVVLPENLNGVLVSSTALNSIMAALDVNKIPLP